MSALLAPGAKASYVPPSANSASGVDAAGNRYAAYIVASATGSVVAVSKLATGAASASWTRTLSLGAVNVTGGMGVDAAGNTYTAVDGLTSASAMLVKLDAQGVWVSSAATPFAAASYAPLVSDVVVDTGTGRVYLDMTYADPSHGGLTSIAAASYDDSLNLQRTQTIDDGPGTADESSGMKLDGAGNLGVGVTMVAGGATTYQVAWFTPGLTRLASRVSAAGPLDMICIDCDSVQYVSGDGQSGPTNATLPGALTTRVVFLYNGQPDLGTFDFASVPAGATKESLSNATLDPNTGLSSAYLTLGELPGEYDVTGGCVGCINNVVTFHETATQNVSLSVRLNPAQVEPSLLDAVTYSQTAVIVHAADAQGNPVANQTVNLTAQAVQASGGHDGPDHGGGRPAGTFAANTCTTNSNGDCIASGGGAPAYTATVFGGQETITATAKLADGTSVGASATLSVAVPLLQDFSQTPSNGTWTLAGNPTTFRACPGKTFHPSSHWIGQDAEIRMLNAIFGYYMSTSQSVPLNDMSLQSGGLFDICGHWVKPHTCHRTGASVDVNLPLGSSAAKKLTHFMYLSGGRKVNEGHSLHFQFPSIESQNYICVGMVKEPL